MSEKTKLIIKIIVTIAALTALATSLGITSCNVTRAVTNESSFFQRGDTGRSTSRLPKRTTQARKACRLRYCIT